MLVFNIVVQIRLFMYICSRLGMLTFWSSYQIILSYIFDCLLKDKCSKNTIWCCIKLRLSHANCHMIDLGKWSKQNNCPIIRRQSRPVLCQGFSPVWFFPFGYLTLIWAASSAVELAFANFVASKPKGKK